MKSFQYASALSPAGARQLIGESGAYLAGGNDLLARMKEYLVEPDILVNIKSVPGLNTIEAGGSTWSIGALVTVAQIEDHEGVGKTFPGLQQAAAEVGSRHIRNVATVGGNLAQHSRCWYYRHRDVLCLKKSGDLCYARRGENKYHSLFTNNSCISPVVSNLSIALAALNASVIIQRGENTVRMTISEFYQPAWGNPAAHNALEPGDLILKVEIPVEQRRSAYLQMSEKETFDWALVSCAASGKVEGGKISAARVFLGAVAPIPYTVQAAMEALEGQVLDEAVADKAADLILAKARVYSHNGYKIPIARALIRRTLMQLKA